MSIKGTKKQHDKKMLFFLKWDLQTVILLNSY